MKKRETVEEMEAQHAAAYARIPSSAEELEEWGDERIWAEPDEIEHEESIQRGATTHEKPNMLAEALERAAEIRSSLEGRQFSDSTLDVIEDHSW